MAESAHGFALQQLSLLNTFAIAVTNMYVRALEAHIPNEIEGTMSATETNSVSEHLKRWGISTGV